MKENNNGRKRNNTRRKVEDLTNETKISVIFRGTEKPVEITGRVEIKNGAIHFLYFGSDESHLRIQRSLSPDTRLVYH